MLWYIIIGMVLIDLWFYKEIKCFIDTKNYNKTHEKELKDWAQKIKDLEEKFNKSTDVWEKRATESMLYVEKQYPPQYNNSDPFSWKTFIGGIVVILIITITVGWIGNMFTGSVLYGGFKDSLTEDYCDYSHNIVAMNDVIGTQGYYLRVDSNLYYVYAVNTSQGVKGGYKLPAIRTYLNYTNSKPHIERYSYRWKEEYKGWIELICLAPAEDYDYDDTYYKAYIPEGSIEYNYNIDFQ